ncbi:MAG: RsmE family RNA methyltransferase [Bacteriovoracaceae bacterium]|nr:RsmE family RNA methyltransferase [Bacteriovoracaceae bacterium]
MNFFTTELLSENSLWQVEDDQFHHFRNVYRGKEGTLVKVFDGVGTIYYGRVEEIKKKALAIKVEKKEVVAKNEGLTLILGVPKKEYLESILKSSIQIGLKAIILVQTKYSPYKFKNSDRIEKLFRSSITQSENPWAPELVHLDQLNEIESLKGSKWVFTTEINEQLGIPEKRPDFIFIGPEGGFHKDELKELSEMKDMSFVRCPTPIMKAEVAVPYCAGFATLGAPGVNPV